jgi:hypothetical protein
MKNHMVRKREIKVHTIKERNQGAHNYLSNLATKQMQSSSRRTSAHTNIQGMHTGEAKSTAA